MPLGYDINTGSLAFSFPCTAVVSVIVALFNLGSFLLCPEPPRGQHMAGFHHTRSSGASDALTVGQGAVYGDAFAYIGPVPG